MSNIIIQEPGITRLPGPGKPASYIIETEYPGFLIEDFGDDKFDSARDDINDTDWFFTDLTRPESGDTPGTVLGRKQWTDHGDGGNKIVPRGLTQSAYLAFGDSYPAGPTGIQATNVPLTVTDYGSRTTTWEWISHGRDDPEGTITKSQIITFAGQGTLDANGRPNDGYFINIQTDGLDGSRFSLRRRDNGSGFVLDELDRANGDSISLYPNTDYHIKITRNSSGLFTATVVGEGYSLSATDTNYTSPDKFGVASNADNSGEPRIGQILVY